jgi:hypothetical protein
MVEKIKLWFEKAGFTSVIYLALAVGVFFFGGLIPIVSMVKTYLVGAFLGIFCYINWNVIRKIWNEEVKTKIDELVDKIEKKIDEKL